MAHLIGKINFSSVINTTIADVDYDDEVKKCVVIPIKDNEISQWNDEWQMWFRIFRYKEPKGRFTHFIMKFIPRSAIKRMSQWQIEQMSKYSIGAVIKTDYNGESQITENGTKDNNNEL